MNQQYLVWADMITSSGDYTSDVLGVFSSYENAMHAIDTQPHSERFVLKSTDVYEFKIDETLTMFYEIKEITLDEVMDL